MSWKIHFYDGVEDSILTMPPKIQARMIKLLEFMEHILAHLIQRQWVMVCLRFEPKRRKVLAGAYSAT